MTENILKSIWLILALIQGAVMPLCASVETNQLAELVPELVTLREKCDVLAENPRDKVALSNLLAYARNTNGIERLRSRAMAAYALTALMNGNTNLYVRSRASHAAKYPAERHLLRVEPAECFLACEECRGEGFIMGVCPLCKGESKCPRCNGKGVLPMPKKLKGSRRANQGVKCPVCGGSGRVVCKRCGGKGVAPIRCPKCKGKPYSFKTPQRVIDDFALLVTGISKWISNEEVFFNRLRDAQSERDPVQRAEALKALLAAYGYRPEMRKIRELLEASRADLTKVKTEKRENELQIKRDMIELRDLTETRHPAAAIREIRDYLEANPETQYRPELEMLIDDLAERIASQRSRRRLLVTAIAALLLLLIVSGLQLRVHKKHRSG